MKVIWEVNDIILGRRYGKPGFIEEWTIGYLAWEHESARYISVSNQDGMVTNPHTKERLAEILTENDYLPLELLQNKPKHK